MTLLLILLSFAPWVLFSVFTGLMSVTIAALVGFLAELLLTIRNGVKHQLKLFELGSLVFFFALTMSSLFVASTWLTMWARELGNITLFLLALGSILIGKPFTLQYARESVDQQYWDSPQFFTINVVISWVWCATFAVMTTSAGVVILARMHENLLFNWLLPIIVPLLALLFTIWYPKWVHQRIGAGQQAH